ncbi:hypothetical protein D3C81_338410 [compost metagenome]
MSRYDRFYIQQLDLLQNIQPFLRICICQNRVMFGEHQIPYYDNFVFRDVHNCITLRVPPAKCNELNATITAMYGHLLIKSYCRQRMY